jgi:hypothetical protein
MYCVESARVDVDFNEVGVLCDAQTFVLERIFKKIDEVTFELLIK